MQRLWLLFAQAVTICVAALFVVSTFRPEWLPSRGPVGGALPAVNVTQQIANPSPAPAAGVARIDSYFDAVNRAAPSVVSVFTSKEVRSAPFNDPRFRRFFGSERATGLGSGVIVSGTGYIVTNNHVVEAADEIEVALPDGNRMLAQVVGSDPETDLAILRVKADKLPAIAFGSSDTLRVGDVVLAIGNPLGIGQTVTAGIVSAVNRSGLGINVFENFIQTDAAINQGNSGGALIDIQGNLVGINTAIVSQSGGSIGIGFAIPASTTQMVLEQIVRTGTVARGWIGVEMQDVSAATAASFKLQGATGALISGVLRNGPADKAGVKPGDVLVSVNDKPVVTAQSVLNAVAGLSPGTDARLALKRQGKDLELNVAVGKRPRPQQRSE
ncbi:MAG TPA: trypsin-like peptidase domain-containing protein [Burkholderiales bacterium]|nr:trypsin-like peptidase domain-containing protein [Burkholderiales bacterium]